MTLNHSWSGNSRNGAGVAKAGAIDRARRCRPSARRLRPPPRPPARPPRRRRRASRPCRRRPRSTRRRRRAHPWCARSEARRRPRGRPSARSPRRSPGLRRRAPDACPQTGRERPLTRCLEPSHGECIKNQVSMKGRLSVLLLRALRAQRHARRTARRRTRSAAASTVSVRLVSSWSTSRRTCTWPPGPNVPDSRPTRTWHSPSSTRYTSSARVRHRRLRRVALAP